MQDNQPATHTGSGCFTFFSSALLVRFLWSINKCLYTCQLLNSLEKLLITETVTVQALYYAMKHLL